MMAVNASVGRQACDDAATALLSHNRAHAATPASPPDTLRREGPLWCNAALPGRGRPSYLPGVGRGDAPRYVGRRHHSKGNPTPQHHHEGHTIVCHEAAQPGAPQPPSPCCQDAEAAEQQRQGQQQAPQPVDEGHGPGFSRAGAVGWVEFMHNALHTQRSAVEQRGSSCR
jgi:hypothetical protein